ncbi:MAG TPA: PAS domain-containing protein, partial [Acidimicrobiales bacterium]
MAAVLDTVFDGVLVATAIRDRGGAVRDFRIEFANRSAHDGDGRPMAAAVGKTLLEVYPELAASPLFEDWVAVTESGETIVRLALARAAVRPSETLQFADVAIARLGDGFVQAWRETTATQELAGELADSRRRLEEAQRIARLGSWEFDVRTEELRWSDELFRIMGLDPREGPLGFGESLEAIVPDDRDKIVVAIARAWRDREPFSFEQRIVRPDGTERLIRTHGEVVEQGGAVAGVRGTTQDVTDQRIAQADHRIAQTLQQSVVAGRLPASPGLALAARYLPATDVADVGVGGDWYDVFEVAGNTFLVVGDVAGHGVAAATTMVQLR